MEVEIELSMGIGDWGLGIGPNPQSPLNISVDKFILEKYNKNKLKKF
jgi:hypothetical protein